MNHRYGSRQKINRFMPFYRGKTPLGMQCIRDFSLDGLCVCFDDCHLCPEIDELVLLELGSGDGSCCIPCQVVRKKSNVCGMLVMAHDDMFFARMSQLHNLSSEHKKEACNDVA